MAWVVHHLTHSKDPQSFAEAVGLVQRLARDISRLLDADPRRVGGEEYARLQLACRVTLAQYRVGPR
jgi:hypothetical protein